MTVIVVNQQAKMTNMITWLKALFVVLLPLMFIAVLNTYSSISTNMTIGILVVYTVFVFLRYKNRFARYLQLQVFLLKIKHGQEFEVTEAHRLVSQFATHVYRIDSKSRMIQFFIGETKHTLKIKKLDKA